MNSNNYKANSDITSTQGRSRILAMLTPPMSFSSYIHLIHSPDFGVVSLLIFILLPHMYAFINLFELDTIGLMFLLCILLSFASFFKRLWDSSNELWFICIAVLKSILWVFHSYLFSHEDEDFWSFGLLKCRYKHSCLCVLVYGYLYF